MKQRKSLVKPVTWQKTCNYIEFFGSSTRDRHAFNVKFSEHLPIYASCMTILGGRTEQHVIIGFGELAAVD